MNEQPGSIETVMIAGPGLTAEWSPQLVEHLEAGVLENYLMRSRWFGGKRRQVSKVRLVQEVPGNWPEGVRFYILEVNYAEGGRDCYVLPLALTGPLAPGTTVEGSPGTVLGHFATGELLVDALAMPAFREALVSVLSGEPEEGGKGVTASGAGLAGIPVEAWGNTRLMSVEQSNTSVAVGDRLWLKLYRKLEAGVQVEVELMERLHASGKFPHVPATYGTLALPLSTGSATIGLLMEKVTHQGDGWAFALASLDKGFDDLLARRVEGGAGPDWLQEGVMKQCLPRAAQLGRRTAELHLALADDQGEGGEFAPEPFAEADREEWCQVVRSAVDRMVRALQDGGHLISPEGWGLATAVLTEQAELTAVSERLRDMPAEGQKVRIHGDLHLAQVLNTGTGFVFIDFEGEPTQLLEARRIKRPALKDVAGMLRSFHYAAAAALKRRTMAEQVVLSTWARDWAEEACRIFLEAYLQGVGEAAFLPPTLEGRERQLRILLLEKAFAEVVYEMNYRPTWADIPLRAVHSLIRPGIPAVPNTLYSNIVS